MIDSSSILQKLSASAEPSIRYLLNTGVLGQDPGSAENRGLQVEIKNSTRVQSLLSHWQGKHPYQKWEGAHWILQLLVDLGYPAGDESLIPLREVELKWLLDSERLSRVPLIEGRYRRCASQEGYAIFSLVRLGLADERVEALVDWLLRWQWPDGGWNCDKNPGAHISSFTESLVPLRGLIAYWQASGDRKLKPVIDRAAEVFLKRQLFKRLQDDRIVRNSFVKLHYPCFWHYDILFGLRVMNEGGYLGDPRCTAALDRLESKLLAGGGFLAEEKYYHVSEEVRTGTTSIEWGPVSTRNMNEFVTVDALTILKKAKRLN
jgi:hypothetical protein